MWGKEEERRSGEGRRAEGAEEEEEGVAAPVSKGTKKTLDRLHEELTLPTLGANNDR